MAETKQYSFDLRDAAIALIKSHEIHNGVWQIGFEFTLGAGNIGPSVEATRPSAFVQINKLLSRDMKKTRRSSGMWWMLQR